MWALSEMIDKAKEVIFITVRLCSAIPCAVIVEIHRRIGGLPRNYTSADPPHISQNGASIDCSSAKQRRALRYM